jgi:hypothetical protein
LIWKLETGVSGCEEVRNSGFLDALSPMPHEV